MTFRAAASSAWASGLYRGEKVRPSVDKVDAPVDRVVATFEDGTSQVVAKRGIE